VIYRLISGDLSADILNIGRLLLQTLWRTIFPYRIGSRQKRLYRTISRMTRPIFKTGHNLSLYISSSIIVIQFIIIQFISCLISIFLIPTSQGNLTCWGHQPYSLDFPLLILASLAILSHSRQYIYSPYHKLSLNEHNLLIAKPNHKKWHRLEVLNLEMERTRKVERITDEGRFDRKALEILIFALSHSCMMPATFYR